MATSGDGSSTVRRKKHSKQSDVINMTDFVCQLQEMIEGNRLRVQGGEVQYQMHENNTGKGSTG